jgi:hypothetical protein
MDDQSTPAPWHVFTRNDGFVFIMATVEGCTTIVAHVETGIEDARRIVDAVNGSHLATSAAECVVCGMKLASRRGGKRNVYCSVNCRMTAYRKRKKDKEARQQ